jgi:hypothetical protein
MMISDVVLAVQMSASRRYDVTDVQINVMARAEAAYCSRRCEVYEGVCMRY